MSIKAATDNRLAISSSEHTTALLEPLIRHNEIRYNKVQRLRPGVRYESHLEEVMRGLQHFIHSRIGKLSKSPVAQTPQLTPISWANENIRLQEFYKHLRDRPGLQKAFRLCEGLRTLCDEQISSMLEQKAYPDKDMDVNLAINEIRVLIGEIVFTVERAPEKLIPQINLDDLAAARGPIFTTTKRLLDDIQLHLTRLDVDVKTYFARDRGMASYTQKPLEIAKILLTSQGQLNLGMAITVHQNFFGSSKKLLEYERGIVFVLERMDISWQKLIDAVDVPKNGASCAMIRADLGMLPTEPITKLHCQQVVLAGLLSQLCKGPAGDCVAVAWAIKKHNEFLQNTITDYVALVRDGYLTRMVNGKPDQFFFKNTIIDNALTNAITMERDGTCKQSMTFWKCPHLIAACRQMGMTDLQSRKDALLGQIFGTNTAAKKMTWDDLIKACAKLAAAPGKNEDELLALGRYGFSMSNNRLLRAWETAVAAMDEDRMGDYVRDKVNNSVMTVFNSVFTSDHISHYNNALVSEVKKVFQKTLNDAFRLVYNSDISLAQVAEDGNSISGGYELYKRDVADLTNMGVRIATPEEFGAFIEGVLDKTLVALEIDNKASKEDRVVIISIIQALHICTKGPDFLRHVLYAYDKNNKQDPDPVVHYQKLQRTPMTSLNGDTIWKVMAVDTGQDFTPDVRTIRPKDPQDLLKWLLGLARWKVSTEHLVKGIPDEEATAASLDYAFNIEMQEPEFKDFLVSHLSAQEWINKTLVDPGKKVASSEMDKGSKLLFSKTAKDWLSNLQSEAIPDHLSQEVDNLFKTLDDKEVTVQQYAERAYNGLTSIFKLDAKQSQEMSFALDKILLKKLPKHQKQAIYQTAVRFAKTNWNEGPKNLYFCCFFNPRTQKVDFGSIDEDRTHLQPMDQFKWVDKQEWEVDPTGMKV